MELQNFTEDISNFFSDIELKKPNLVHILENYREKIIEKLRTLKKDDLMNINLEIKKNIKTIKKITFKNIKFDIFLHHHEKNQVIDKTKTNFNFLEIALNGRKDYKIFDKYDNSRFINYKIIPFYGVVLSSETIFSSKINNNSSILTINVDNNFGKDDLNIERK